MCVRKLTVFLLSALSVLAIAEPSASTLTPFEASLKATRHGAFDISVNGTLSYQVDNRGNWQYSLITDKGLVNSQEVSRGRIVDDVFQTSSYRKNAKVLMIRERSEWDFNWDTMSVQGTVDKDDVAHTLNSITYDPLSYQLALRTGLQNGETEFEFQYLRYKNPTTARFMVIGEELLDVGDGRVLTKIIRQTAPVSADTKRLIWVSPELDYIPVRFATYVNDKIRDDVRVTAVKIDGTNVMLN